MRALEIRDSGDGGVSPAARALYTVRQYAVCAYLGVGDSEGERVLVGNPY